MALEYRTVFTDGACKNNQGPVESRTAGVGVWFENDSPYNVSRRTYGKDTNNQGEAEAILDAVQTIVYRLSKEDQKVVWKIKTDSRYCVDSINRDFKNWEARGGLKADGKPAIHYELFKNIIMLIRHHGAIELEWIPREQNANADRLANLGCLQEKTTTEMPYVTDEEWKRLEILTKQIDDNVDLDDDSIEKTEHDAVYTLGILFTKTVEDKIMEGKLSSTLFTPYIDSLSKTSWGVPSSICVSRFESLITALKKRGKLCIIVDGNVRSDKLRRIFGISDKIIIFAKKDDNVPQWSKVVCRKLGLENVKYIII